MGVKVKYTVVQMQGGKSQLVCDEHILNIVLKQTRMYSIVSVV